MVVNIASVRFGSPLSRTTRTASATASPTASDVPIGVTENATSKSSSSRQLQANYPNEPWSTSHAAISPAPAPAPAQHDPARKYINHEMPGKDHFVGDLGGQAP